ncbi:hypothetical protein BgiMline_031012 [Biomphalaria glabrata]|nr:hypothetical protein BgiMline_018982 [Biomphalaria glabrata]
MVFISFINILFVVFLTNCAAHVLLTPGTDAIIADIVAVNLLYNIPLSQCFGTVDKDFSLIKSKHERPQRLEINFFSLPLVAQCGGTIIAGVAGKWKEMTCLTLGGHLWAPYGLNRWHH